MRARVDWFLVGIVVSAVIATLLPARGAAVLVVDVLATALIAVLFFLYGARLEPRQVKAGIANWRLHLVILGFTYLVFPLVGILLRPLSPGLISHDLYLGIFYLCLVPSTVQSSINFTSIAGGNVAGAIVSASVSNILGVFITPVLVLVLMGTGGELHVDPSAIVNIVAQILVPFVIGQLSRRWTADFVAAHPRLKLVDQASILVVVYSAFSAGMREHMWSRIGVRDLIFVVIVCLAVLAGMLTVTKVIPRAMKFDPADQIAIQFCGTKKSLATGLPMANVLFAGSQVGLLVLPLMIFHQLQLMFCGWLAGRYARRGGAQLRAERDDATPARPSDHPRG